MIICHCNSIADADIHAAVDWMRAADPDTVITPGKVYRALGKRPDCGSCLPLFIDAMQSCGSFEVPSALRGLRRTGMGAENEGRADSHRVSESGA